MASGSKDAPVKSISNRTERRGWPVRKSGTIRAISSTSPAKQFEKSTKRICLPSSLMNRRRLSMARNPAPLRLLSIPTCKSHFSHPAKFLPLALVCIELLLDGWLTFDRPTCRVRRELCIAVFADSQHRDSGGSLYNSKIALWHGYTLPSRQVNIGLNCSRWFLHVFHARVVSHRGYSLATPLASANRAVSTDFEARYQDVEVAIAL